MPFDRNAYPVYGAEVSAPQAPCGVTIRPEGKGEMTTPPRPTGSPHSERSDQSWDSSRSNASNYGTIELRESRRTGQTRVSVPGRPTEVPEDAPALPPNAEVGLYDRRNNQYFSYATLEGMGETLMRWSNEAVQWVAEHRVELLKALGDLAPSGVQGLSPWMPAKEAVNATGIGLQGAKGAWEIAAQLQERFKGVNSSTGPNWRRAWPDWHPWRSTRPAP